MKGITKKVFLFCNAADPWCPGSMRTGLSSVGSLAVPEGPGLQGTIVQLSFSITCDLRSASVGAKPVSAGHRAPFLEKCT